MRTAGNNSFDLIAPFYDRLAGLVFGRHLYNAQVHFLDEISTCNNLLILGGGTGWLLEEVLRRNERASVWYVEASARMLDLSRKKNGLLGDRVHYIHGTEETLPDAIAFDAVITNFYLDLFSPVTLPDVMQRIIGSLSAEAIWLVSDFIQPPSQKEKMLLRAMYRFFKLVSRIEASQLPDWQNALCDAGLLEVKASVFYRSFVKSAVYFKQQSA